MQERIAWTRRQLYGVDESITTLNEKLWMTSNEEHYSTAKRMIFASSMRTFNNARSIYGTCEFKLVALLLALMKIRA